MSTFDAYRRKIEAELKVLKAEMERLDARLQGAEADARLWFEKERKAIADKEAELRRRLDRLEQAGSDALEELERGVRNAWRDLKTAFERARDKF
ncbi:MAG: hypothetical protein D6763_04905 [Alphaproteobacteria bacterium]|nr:MAG: hypothetical protein D6763_04905 [Alphaproteobacteria bacterium]